MLNHPESLTQLCVTVLVSNFVGVTSFLLGLDGGGLASSLRLDTLFPVAGFKRCYDPRNGFGAALVSALLYGSCTIQPVCRGAAWAWQNA